MKNRILTIIFPLVVMIGAALATSPQPPPTSAPALTVADVRIRPQADMRPVRFISTHGAPRTPENPLGLNRNLIDPRQGNDNRSAIRYRDAGRVADHDLRVSPARRHAGHADRHPAHGGRPAGRDDRLRR